VPQTGEPISAEAKSKQQFSKQDIFKYLTQISYLSRFCLWWKICSTVVRMEALRHIVGEGKMSTVSKMGEGERSWEFSRRMPVCHFINAFWAPSNRQARQSSDPSQQAGFEFACRLLKFTRIIAIHYYYSTRKLVLNLPSHKGCKAESTAVTVCGCTSRWLSCPRLSWDSILRFSTRSQICYR